MNEYQDSRRCDYCQGDLWKANQTTGPIGTSEDCSRDCQARLQLDELTSAYEQFEDCASKVSLTEGLLAVVLLLEHDHAATAGLVSAFMASAMNTSMGGD